MQCPKKKQCILGDQPACARPTCILYTHVKCILGCKCAYRHVQRSTTLQHGCVKFNLRKNLLGSKRKANNYDLHLYYRSFRLVSSLQSANSLLKSIKFNLNLHIKL